jgi:hypothetical protein
MEAMKIRKIQPLLEPFLTQTDAPYTTQYSVSLTKSLNCAVHNGFLGQLSLCASK